MAELTTDAQALSEAATSFDGITHFFLFEDRSSEAGAGMQDTEKGVSGMFASTPVDGDVGTHAVGMQDTEKGITGMFACTGDAGGEAATSFDRISSDLKAAIGQVDAVQELDMIYENINRAGTQYQ